MYCKKNPKIIEIYGRTYSITTLHVFLRIIFPYIISIFIKPSLSFFCHHLPGNACHESLPKYNQLRRRIRRATIGATFQVKKSTPVHHQSPKGQDIQNPTTRESIPLQLLLQACTFTTKTPFYLSALFALDHRNPCHPNPDSFHYRTFSLLYIPSPASEILRL